MKNSYTTIRRILLGTTIVVLVSIGATAFMYTRTTARQDNVILEVLNARIEYVPGVRINGIDVSGKTLEEATALMQQQQPPKLGQLKITNGETEEVLDLSSLVPTMNVDQMLEKALDYGNGGDAQLRETQRQQAALQGVDFDTDNAYDLSLLRADIERIATKLYVAPVEAEVKIIGKEKPEAQQTTEEDASEAIDTVEAAENGEEDEVDEIIQARSPITIDENGEVKGFEQLFEYKEAIPGKQIEADKLYQQIEMLVQAGDVVDNQVIEAPVEAVPAEKNIEDIKQDFKLISTATSYMKGNYGKKNRVFNINKAAEIINGYILEPGESFAFNSVLGPRTEKNGWKAAGAISNGQSVEETGGGICQVSSTTYNAVLMADLQIDERHPHSWPLSYLPAGQDATISTGGPDFVFTNNKDKPIVLVAYVNLDDMSLTAQFYGEPLPNNGEIKLVSEQTETLPQPATKYITDSSKARKGRAGSKWETYKEYYENGELVKRESSHRSTYRAIAGMTVKRAEKAPEPKVPTEVAPQVSEVREEPRQEEAPKKEAPKKTESPKEIEEIIPIEIG